MEIVVLTVGIDPYENNTQRLVNSIAEHEPDIPIVVVDAAAEPPYPDYDFVFRLDKRPSGFAAGLNIAATLTDADWMVMVNNDTEAKAPFAWRLETLTPGVYGNYMMHERGRKWLDGWIMVIHREVWRRVGRFDENFLAGAYEDADYCFRAEALGYPVDEIAMPFVHHELHTRFDNPEFWEKRQANYEYLWSKHG